MIKAYDIALIPKKEIAEKCYQINETIVDRKNIDFRSHGQLPHITLIMGGVRESDIKNITQELAKIVNSIESVEITLTSIHEGKFASGIEIASSAQLSDLHEMIINQFAERFSNKVSVDDIIGLPNVTEGTANIINNYQSKSILENFDPHITIGDGIPVVEDGTFPITFSSNGELLYFC